MFGGHQRQPAAELVGVLDQLGAREQRVTGQRLLAASQVVDAVGPAHEARMRNRVDEPGRPGCRSHRRPRIGG